METESNKLQLFLEQGSQVAHTAMRTRGSIIDLASDAENEVANIITWCFYPAKYSTKQVSNELLDENGIIFKSIILKRIDFRDKISMLKEVIQAKNPNIWKSHSHLIKSICSDLDKIRTFRNLMAHSSSDLSTEYLKSIETKEHKRNEEFQVVEFNKGKLIKHRITKNKFIVEWLRCVRTVLKLSQLFAIINGDTKTYEDNKELVNLINI